MDLNYFEYMTNDMKECLEFTNQEILKEEFLMCQEKYLKCKKSSSIQLPAETEDGKPVLHGSRIVVYSLEKYWFGRMNLAKQFLHRDWVSENVK